MGDLPIELITPSPPFTHTDVDFAGPFVTLNGKQLSKSYLALFVCFTTKAIHLELTSGLSSQSCTAALRRARWEVLQQGCTQTERCWN